MDFTEPILAPLPYHTALRDYLKAEEPDLWRWFASAQAQAKYMEELRLELLKSTYRLHPDSHPGLYEAVSEAKQRLGLEVPVTAYQAQSQSNQPLNAALFYVPGEGHLVFSGPALSLLDPNELKSVVGHELSHYHLWQCEQGEFHIADRLLQAVGQDARAVPSQVQSARWFQLYTEIFADRGSFQVAGDLHPVVASLVKMETGLAQVSPASYLAQAEEIFAATQVKTSGLSHPETFIRARALALWSQNGSACNDAITAMMEGAAELDELDLLGQQRWTEVTRRVLEQLLRPKWFQTPATMGHARSFFDDFQPAASAANVVLPGPAKLEPKLRQYLAYVLLDFVAADPDLEDLPLAAALQLAGALGVLDLLEKLVLKELKWKAREVKRVKEQAAEVLGRAEPAP